MKLISPNMLNKMRRGAEHLYKKHRDSLPTATTLLTQDIAKELGLPTKDIKPSPIAVAASEPVGLFDDEETEQTVTPTAMAKVKLTDYIEALKVYETGDSKKKA